jgi:hypothetical protein
MAGAGDRRGSAVLVDREHLTYVRVTSPGSASTWAQRCHHQRLGLPKSSPCLRHRSSTAAQT